MARLLVGYLAATISSTTLKWQPVGLLESAKYYPSTGGVDRNSQRTPVLPKLKDDRPLALLDEITTTP